jgi:aerobic carbon-monoxide dehydrogenase large subunit
MRIRCQVDGTATDTTIDARESLADFLTRTGNPVNTGCGTGACGVCLVRLDGRPVRSCAVLAAQVDGATVQTVRGLADDTTMCRVRGAMSGCSAVQCGYCSPAFALTLHDLAGEPAGDVRRELSEVVCRCTGYTGLVAARTAEHDTPPRRVEDARLLGGHGDFIGARTLPGQLSARFVRSEHAHAGIVAVRTDRARALPGVVDVVTAADLPAAAAEMPPRSEGPREPTLAGAEVRYVGQPIAMVLAETPQLAEDAAELVDVEYAPRTPWLAPVIAGAPHVFAARTQCDPLPADLFTTADVVVDEWFTVPRQTGLPMEPRGLLAAAGTNGRLTVWGVTKHPRANRDDVAKALGLAMDAIHMPPGDVGGAFGVKGELYPEDILVPLAALRAGRPVKWVEDRDEHLVAINHSRGQAWHVRIAATAGGRLLGAEVEVVSDAGAYVRPLTTLMPDEATATFPGPYRFGAYHATASCVLTNKTPCGPVRAPGRFESNFVRERALDLLAERVGLHPAELRRRNLLTGADLPYDVGTYGEGPVRYPAGDFLAAFEDLVAAAPAPDSADGLRRGRAVVPFVELSSLGGTERARLTVLADNRIRVEVASAPSGQGHQTAWALLVARTLDVPVTDVEVCCGDTDGGGVGLGTFASRSAVMVGNAVAAAARRLAEQGVEPGRVVDADYTSDEHTCAYGALACAVAVDPELLTVRVEELTIRADAGNVIDEHLVTGQLIGGVVQGVGGALLEELTYDAAGRPLAPGLDGYLPPLAADVPTVHVRLTNESPAESNPLGVKGIGEAGIAAAGAAMASAVCAAMPELNHTLTGLPVHPSRLLDALNRATASAQPPVPLEEEMDA